MKKYRIVTALSLGAILVGGVAVVGAGAASNELPGGAIRSVEGEQVPRISDDQFEEMKEAMVAEAKRSQRALASSIRATAYSTNRGAVSASGNKRGPRGPRGAQGPAGPQGAPGSSETYTVVSPTFNVEAYDYGNYTAPCRAGSKAISGGFYQTRVTAYLNSSSPGTGSDWNYSFTNASSGTSQVFFVTTCAV